MGERVYSQRIIYGGEAFKALLYNQQLKCWRGRGREMQGSSV